VAGDTAEFGGKVKLEENIWGGLGGFGRNGRSKAPGSSAALQTPRPIRYAVIQNAAASKCKAPLHAHAPYALL